jgi:hypothetical protein
VVAKCHERLVPSNKNHYGKPSSLLLSLPTSALSILLSFSFSFSFTLALSLSLPSQPNFFVFSFFFLLLLSLQSRAIQHPTSRVSTSGPKENESLFRTLWTSFSQSLTLSSTKGSKQLQESVQLFQVPWRAWSIKCWSEWRSFGRTTITTAIFEYFFFLLFHFTCTESNDTQESSRKGKRTKRKRPRTRDCILNKYRTRSNF